jgi:hypothetical protein
MYQFVISSNKDAEFWSALEIQHTESIQTYTE